MFLACGKCSAGKLNLENKLSLFWTLNDYENEHTLQNKYKRTIIFQMQLNIHFFH